MTATNGKPKRVDDYQLVVMRDGKALTAKDCREIGKKVREAMTGVSLQVVVKQARFTITPAKLRDWNIFASLFLGIKRWVSTMSANPAKLLGEKDLVQRLIADDKDLQMAEIGDPKGNHKVGSPAIDSNGRIRYNDASHSKAAEVAHGVLAARDVYVQDLTHQKESSDLTPEEEEAVAIESGDITPEQWAAFQARRRQLMAAKKERGITGKTSLVKKAS